MSGRLGRPGTESMVNAVDSARRVGSRITQSGAEGMFRGRGFSEQRSRVCDRVSRIGGGMGR